MVGRLTVVALLAVSLLSISALFSGVAFADPPDTDSGQQAEPCHGSNDEDCREDPQPDRGQDCKHSDDHVCDGSTAGPVEEDDEDEPNLQDEEEDDDTVLVPEVVIPSQPEAFGGGVVEQAVELQVNEVLSSSPVLDAPVQVIAQPQLTSEVLGSTIKPPETGDGGLSN